LATGSFGRFRAPGTLAAAAAADRGYTREHARDAERMSPSADDFPRIVEVVVEIPRGSRNKYEYDEAAGVFRLDRVLASAVHYNFDYGFITDTRAGDGDHTDALLLIDEPTFPGCRVWARPIGGLEMRDDKGEDFKVLCVAVADPHQAHVDDLDQVRPHRLVEIEHFFNTYKLLEAKETDVVGWRDASRARQTLVDDRATYERERTLASGIAD
jgi:inorganic pyrophosphatase